MNQLRRTAGLRARPLEVSLSAHLRAESCRAVRVLDLERSVEAPAHAVGDAIGA